MSEFLLFIVAFIFILPFVWGIRFLASRHSEAFKNEAEEHIEAHFGVTPSFIHGFGKIAFAILEGRDFLVLYERDKKLRSISFDEIDHWFVGKIKTEIISSQTASVANNLNDASVIRARSAESLYLILSNKKVGRICQIGIVNQNRADEITQQLDITLLGKRIERAIHKKDILETFSAKA